MAGETRGAIEAPRAFVARVVGRLAKQRIGAMDEERLAARTTRRIVAYILVALGLVVLRLSAGPTYFQANEYVHTVVGAITAVVSLIVGALALVRFEARKTERLLLAGVAFAGASILDAAHVGIAATLMNEDPTAIGAPIIHFSWYWGRLFLAAVLAVRARSVTRSADHSVTVSATAVVVASLALLVLCVASTSFLPYAYVPGFAIPRPYELVPALLLAFALLGHLRSRAYRDDPFESALILALILEFGTEALFMAFSSAPHDAMSVIAHTLKLVGNFVALGGLLRGTLHLFRTAELEHTERTFGFLENLPVGVFILDAKGKPYYANERAVELVGRGADSRISIDDLATSLGMYLSGSDDAYPVEQLPVLRALHGESVVVSDMEIRRGDEIVSIQVSAAPIFDSEGRVAYAVAAFQDIRELRRVALEDPLTRLANRTAFHEQYRRLASLSWRGNQTVCVAAIDLDRFKSINDTYGHDVGDAVLCRVAEIITKSVRTGDVVARWGGEEIAVLFPGATLAGAIEALERALTALRAETFESDGTTFTVTFSAGVVEVEEDTSADDAVAHADRFMYAAKTAGRNRVCFPE